MIFGFGKEKKELKRKEEAKQKRKDREKEIGPEAFKKEMAEIYYNEYISANNVALESTNFNFDEFDNYKWVVQSVCTECSFFEHLSNYGIYEIEFKDEFEKWLELQEEYRYGGWTVTQCPRHKFNDSQPHHSHGYCLGFKNEIDYDVYSVLRAHYIFLHERQKGHMLTKEQNERFKKISALGITPTHEQIMQGEPYAKNHFIEDPLKNFPHPFSRYCLRGMRGASFICFSSLEEYEKDPHLLLGFVERIYEKEKARNYKEKEISSTHYDDYDPLIELNFYTLSYESFIKIAKDNTLEESHKSDGSFYGLQIGTHDRLVDEDIVLPELDFIKSIKVQDEFSHEQERQQKEIAKKYIKGHN